MDIKSIPEAFQSKVRLAIITALISGEKTFTQLKKLTQASDGNLASHLSKLEEMEQIFVRKEFIGKKPTSTYILTDIGRKSFTEYVDMLYGELHK